MRIPHNQQLGHTLLIITPMAYHDNWSVLDQQQLPGLECRSDKANNVVVCFKVNS